MASPIPGLCDLPGAAMQLPGAALSGRADDATEYWVGEVAVR